MKTKLTNINNLFLIFVIIFSFSINYFYANIGVSPMDTFAFFDTAYNILLDRHPFKDIWVTTGPFVDYLQSIFFKIFGLNWKSYVIHGSIFNTIIATSFYLVLIKFNLNKYIALFYTVCFSILCYPISGTPFAYIHSYVLSLLAILIFIYSVKFENKILFFFLPIIMFLSFASMQNPSTFINLILLISILAYVFLFKQFEIFKFFIGGCVFTLISILFFLNLNKIPIENILQQYFLFPLTMAENRISGNDMAHISLSGGFTFRNIIGHFKFINLYIILFIFFSFLEIKKQKLSKENLMFNLIFIFSAIFLIFNQLITSNQTFIFSIIPFLGGFFHIYINDRFLNLKKFQIFLLLVVSLITVKYHLEYNEKRKFMDLQNANLKKYTNGSTIDKKLDGLKWITPAFSNNSKEEAKILKDTIKAIKKIQVEKMVITNYQIFSLILEENLNIPNRWYSHDNNSYPLKNHRYFKFYKNHLRKTIEKNGVKTIIIVGNLKFENFNMYLENYCFEKIKVNKLTTKYNLKNCT